MTQRLEDFIAAVTNLSRPQYSWNFARRGSAALVLLIGDAFDVDPPYRSPHSSAGNYTRCDTDSPDADCVSGGWWLSGRCNREEADRGCCPHRRQGAPALTPQRSEHISAPRVSPTPTRSQMAVKEWVVRNTCNAAREGDKRVKRAALAYLAGENCELDDIHALGTWMSARLGEEKPWKKAA